MRSWQRASVGGASYEGWAQAGWALLPAFCPVPGAVSCKVAINWTQPSHPRFRIPEATTLSPQGQQSWHRPAGNPSRKAQETGEGEARPVLWEVRPDWDRCCLALNLPAANLPLRLWGLHTSGRCFFGDRRLFPSLRASLACRTSHPSQVSWFLSDLVSPGWFQRFSLIGKHQKLRFWFDRSGMVQEFRPGNPCNHDLL